jgi:hypothetical protein
MKLRSSLGHLSVNARRTLESLRSSDGDRSGRSALWDLVPISVVSRVDLLDLKHVRASTPGISGT